MKTYTVKLNGVDLDIKQDDDGKFIIPEGWRGVGTALKPAMEPACFARKPLSEKTVAANVLKHGTGAINVDACRIATSDNRARMNNARISGSSYVVQKEAKFIDPGGDGRWPANLCHDGSSEALALFPDNQDRYFYCAKVSPRERGDSRHPTMKPIALMEWLIKLVTPPGGTILDPFMGSGSTGLAAVRNGFQFVGIERDPEHFATAVKRIKAALA